MVREIVQRAGLSLCDWCLDVTDKWHIYLMVGKIGCIFFNLSVQSTQNKQVKTRLADFMFICQNKQKLYQKYQSKVIISWYLWYFLGFFPVIKLRSHNIQCVFHSSPLVTFGLCVIWIIKSHSPQRAPLFFCLTFSCLMTCFLIIYRNKSKPVQRVTSALIVGSQTHAQIMHSSQVWSNANPNPGLVSLNAIREKFACKVHAQVHQMWVCPVAGLFSETCP